MRFGTYIDRDLIAWDRGVIAAEMYETLRAVMARYDTMSRVVADERRTPRPQRTGNIEAVGGR